MDASIEVILDSDVTQLEGFLSTKSSGIVEVT